MLFFFFLSRSKKKKSVTKYQYKKMLRMFTEPAGNFQCTIKSSSDMITCKLQVNTDVPSY